MFERVINKGLVKNFVILILVVSSIYQTGKLWFEEYSSRNFFYSFYTKNISKTIADEQSSFVTPYRIITNYNDKTFDITYSDINNSDAKKLCDEAIGSVLKDGEFESTNPIEWEKILEKPFFMYEYNFQMPTDLFINGFSKKSASLSSKVKAFNSVLIQADEASVDKMKIIFLDYENKNSYSFTIKNQTLLNSIITTIHANFAADRTLRYFSTSQREGNALNNNIFIPEWITNEYEYPAIEMVNPYGDELMDKVNKQVDMFFDNPMSKVPELVNDEFYMYSNENVVVNYLRNTSVLEYSDYKPSYNTVNTTIIDDFNQAVRFIQKDGSTIANEFYLSEYESSGTIRKFYFDYVINNFPLIFSDNLSSEINMKHHIEITVEDGKVTKYKKYVYNYIISNEVIEHATVGFKEAYSKHGDVKNFEADGFRDAILGFRIDDKNKELLLNWMCINVNGKTFAMSSK